MPGHKDVLMFPRGNVGSLGAEIGQNRGNARSMIKVTKAVRNLIYVTCENIPLYKGRTLSGCDGNQLFWLLSPAYVDGSRE